MNCHVHCEQHRENNPENNPQYGENDDLEPEVVHDDLLVHADCLEDPDLPATIEGLDRDDDEQDDGRDDDAHNEGDKVDDRKTLESCSQTLGEQVRCGLHLLVDPVLDQLVLDEGLGIAGFCLDRDVVRLVERLAQDLLHISPGDVRGAVRLAPSGGVNTLHPVVSRVAVCELDRDRVANPDPAKRGLKLVFLSDSCVAGHGLPDDNLARVAFAKVIAGNHLGVQRGDVLLIIRLYRPHRDPENTLVIREGRPLGIMGGGSLYAGHAVDETERCVKIRDVLVARLGADKHVPDLVVHKLLRYALLDPVEQGGQEDHVGEAHPDNQDGQDCARSVAPLERSQREKECNLQSFFIHGKDLAPFFLGKYQNQ